MERRIDIKTSTALKFILPAFLVYCFAIIVPLVLAVGMSFTNWKGGTSIDFIGFDNYVSVLSNKYFWSAFWHNIQFIGFLLIMQIGIAFVVALIYQSKRIKFREFHRRVIFMPSVLSAMVVGLIWQLVYRTDIGFIAEIMRRVGLEDYIIPWLDSTDLVIFAICIALTWQFVGQYSIILTAGMQNVGQELLESAEIDGANAVQRAVHIVFPLLKPTIAVCSTICISGCMKLFDIVISMSGGGPAQASMVTALYTYNLAFIEQRLGYASASAVCMIILSLTLVMVARKILLREDKDEK